MLDGRALPHVAEILKSGNLELALEQPSVLQFFGRINQDTAALIQGLGTDDHVIFVFSRHPDDLGIALVLRVGRIGAEQGKGIFFRPSVVAQAGQTGVGVAGPVGIPVVAGVVEIDLVPDGHGGTGVDSLVVVTVLLVGQKADAQILPGHKVFGNNMIPVLEPVHCPPGTPLIEKMPAVVVPDKAVGIVHQTGHRLIVEVLAVDGGGNFLIQLAQFLRILQITILFLPGPFSHDEVSFPPRQGLHISAHFPGFVPSL